MAWMKISNENGNLSIEGEGSMVEMAGLLELAKLDLRCRVIGELEAGRVDPAKQQLQPD
jgi:hypothetical protein